MIGLTPQAIENMNCHEELDNGTFQMQEYMKHYAEFQRRLASVREARALWEKTQRMRKERASHMGFQFKQIVWEMRRAQDDAHLAQERYLKLLQLDSGHPMRYQKWNARVQDKQDNSLPVNRVAHQSDHEANQDTSHQNEHQNQAPPYVQYDCVDDVADLDSTKGTSFRSFTTVEETDATMRKNNCPTKEPVSYSSPTTNDAEASVEERLSQKESGEPITAANLSNVSEKDDFVSTSLFVHGDLDSQVFLLEQRKTATNLVCGGNKVAEEQPVTTPLCDKKDGQEMSWLQGIDNNKMDYSQPNLPVSTMPTSILCGEEKHYQGQEILCVKNSTDGDKQLENCEMDLRVSSMPITPTAEEVARRDAEKKRSEEVGNPFFKVQKNDFLSQKIANELEEFTAKSSLCCFASKPTHGSEQSCIYRDGGACRAESAAEKTVVIARGESINRVTHGPVEKSELSAEEKRRIMKTWHPEEKLGVLRTITNTMFLWEIEQSSGQKQYYGSWSNIQLILSAAHAAKSSQRDLFEFLETVEENTSRPLICCGAVCEVLKAYPPEHLLPLRFFTDFFASQSIAEDGQGMNGRLVDGLNFDHLEEYQEVQHRKFWQTLVHHVVSVKDHNLASFSQIASVYVDILLPSTHTEVFPAQMTKGFQLRLLQFLIDGFKAKTLHLFQVHYEDDECSTAHQKRSQHNSKDSDGKIGLLDKHRTEISKGYKLRRSSHLRSVSARKGLLSCFGSRVRTWRLKALSRGVDTVDDALVCLLTKNGYPEQNN